MRRFCLTGETTFLSYPQQESVDFLNIGGIIPTMDVPLNEYELSEVERLITLGLHQTDASEMRSDMIRMILEGIERVLDHAKENQKKGC